MLTSFDFEVTGQFERHPRLHGDAGPERWQVLQLFCPQSGGEQNIILKLISIFTWELPDIRVLPNCELAGGMYNVYIIYMMFLIFLFEIQSISNGMWWKCKDITDYRGVACRPGSSGILW